MDKSIVTALVFLCLMGCGATYRPRDESPRQAVKLSDAIREVSSALRTVAENSEPRHGLLPEEVTVEFNISVANGEQDSSGVKIAVGTLIAELPEITQTRTQSATSATGNKISIKFKNVAFAPTLRSKEDVDKMKLEWHDYMLRMPDEQRIGEIALDPAPLAR